MDMYPGVTRGFRVIHNSLDTRTIPRELYTGGIGISALAHNNTLQLDIVLEFSVIFDSQTEGLVKKTDDGNHCSC